MPVQVGEDGRVNCGGCTVAFPYGRHVNEPLTHPIYGAPYESFWANFACVLIRTEVIRECGLLDENMRFICSDADYSFTARARGWKITVVPTAIVQHEPDGALQCQNEFIEQCKDEDALYFLKKWLSGMLYRDLSAEGASLTGEIIGARYSELTTRLAARGKI
jgi:GT2 family glycosyltransferase